METPQSIDRNARCLGAAGILLLSSCGIQQHIDHQAHQKTPDAPSSRFWRALAHSNPYSESR